MHIPDGFLATPVWASLDALAIPAVALVARRAQRDTQEHRIPLLGVMGAFVFAAQMINFPVGIGTSGHLVGAALLSFTLGPAAASLVMTAILALQALVFQDGGILALGANITNMALVGVFAGYLPYRLGAGRRWAMFLGATLSVLLSAILALSELLLSGVRMPQAVLGVSLALFLVSALIEGAITVSVMMSLDALQPGLVRRPQHLLPERHARAWAAIALFSILLATVGVLLASTRPDGIWRLAGQVGIASNATVWLRTPFADYRLAFVHSPWMGKAAAGLFGLLSIYAVCLLLGRIVLRSRREAA